jgi:hypothetical protein
MDRDFVFGSATLATSVAYYWMASTIPSSQLSDAVGPQGLPKTYAVLLGGLSLVLIGRSRAKRRRAAQSEENPAPTARRQGRSLWRVAGMLAIGAAYIALAPVLGYVVAIAGLILATTYYQGGSINRQVALVAVGGAIFFWLLFVVIMGIPQPAGWWSSLL